MKSCRSFVTLSYSFVESSKRALSSEIVFPVFCFICISWFFNCVSFFDDSLIQDMSLLLLLADAAVRGGDIESSWSGGAVSKLVSIICSVDSEAVSDIVGEGDFDSTEKLSYIMVSIAVLTEEGGMSQRSDALSLL